MAQHRSVIMLMFDIPFETKKQRREYSAFRKYLKSNGYYYLQKSVYVKLLQNGRKLNSELARLKKAAPSDGNLTVLPMTLPNFAKIDALTGTGFDLELFSEEIVYV